MWLCGSIEAVSLVPLGSFECPIGLKNLCHPAAEFTCSEEVLCIFGAVRERDISGRYSLCLQAPCQKSHYCLILQYSQSKPTILESKQQAKLGLFIISSSVLFLSPSFFLFEAISSVAHRFTHRTRVTHQDSAG